MNARVQRDKRTELERNFIMQLRMCGGQFFIIHQIKFLQLLLSANCGCTFRSCFVYIYVYASNFNRLRSVDEAAATFLAFTDKMVICVQTGTVVIVISIILLVVVAVIMHGLVKFVSCRAMPTMAKPSKTKGVMYS